MQNQPSVAVGQFNPQTGASPEIVQYLPISSVGNGLAYDPVNQHLILTVGDSGKEGYWSLYTQVSLFYCLI